MNRLPNPNVIGQQRTISRYGMASGNNANVKLPPQVIRRPIGTTMNSTNRYSPYTSGNIRTSMQYNQQNRSTILIRRDATGTFT